MDRETEFEDKERLFKRKGLNYWAQIIGAPYGS